MNKTQFISFVKQDIKLSRANVSLIFDEFIGSIGTALKNNQTIYLRGFGKFVPPKRKLKDVNYDKKLFRWTPFRPYKDLKNKLNGKKTIFEIYLEDN